MHAPARPKSPPERLFDLSLDMLCVAGLDGYFKQINHAFERTLGHRAEDLLARPFIDFVHPDDRAATQREMEKLSAGALTLHFENRYRCANGTYKWLSWTTFPDPEGLLFAVARDITVQKATEGNLSRTNLLLRTVNRAQARFIEGTGRAELFDSLLEALLKLTDSMYGFIGEVLYDPENRPYLRMHSISNIAWNDETRVQYERAAENGMEFRNLDTLFGRVMTESRPIISNDPLHDPRAGGLPQGHPAMSAFAGMPFFRGKDLIGVVGLANRPGGYGLGLIEFLQPFLTTCAGLLEGFRNQSRRENAERALDRMSRLDDLTGLPNRRAFLERLATEIQRAQRYPSPLSLLAISLDHFTNVNDVYGRAAGDAALRGVAQILQSECRTTDYAGRLGGKEFVIFLTQTDRDNAATIAERIRAHVADRVFQGSGGQTFRVTCSIGGATLTGDNTDPDALITDADKRLYEAKTLGRNRICL